MTAISSPATTWKPSVLQLGLHRAALEIKLLTGMCFPWSWCSFSPS